MTMQTKKELFGVELDTYLASTKKEKGKILDALERQTGMWRESIMRGFRRLQLASGYSPPKKRGRKAYYTLDDDIALKELWGIANHCCGELLRPVISEYIQVLERDKMWKHGDVVTSRLRAMSMATVKRRVSGWRCEGRRGISTTTPSAIKSRVPIFEGSWYEVSVGMGQIDTVAHCGGSLLGDFFYSCGYVDVSSGWVQYTAQWNKGMEVTKESLVHIESRLPFRLLHLHPDCGTEFLNQVVMVWAEEENIEFSRSRSYHKNDNGYIEQRNGHIARRWLGYERLDNREQLPLLVKFLDLVCQYHNHFIAQRLCTGTKKLESDKERKVYEKMGMTPYSRLLENPKATEDVKEELWNEHENLNPKTSRDKILKMKSAMFKDNRNAKEGKLLH